MTEKLAIILLFGLTFIGCSYSNDCNNLLKNKVKPSELHSDSTELILTICGGLDSLDLKILKSSTITEMVNTIDFQEGKYDYARLTSDFERFRKKQLYADLRTTYVLKEKKFISNDWPTDSVQLVRLFDLKPDDISILKNIISDPDNKQMTYSEAFKEMNKIQIQNSINEIGKRMKEK